MEPSNVGLLMCLTNGSCDCVNSSAYCPVIEFHTEGVRGANLGAAVVRYRADLELHRRIERRGQFRSSFSASPVQFLRQRAKLLEVLQLWNINLLLDVCM